MASVDEKSPDDINVTPMVDLYLVLLLIFIVMTAAGVKVWPSEGNFLLADFGSPEKAKAADAALKSRGLIMRAMGGYGLPACLRISIGTGEECQMVADAIAAFMAQHG